MTKVHAQSLSKDCNQSDAWVLKRTIPSDTSIGSGLVVELIEEMMARDWPAIDMFRVQLAYEEAMVNAIRHGNRHSEDKVVDILVVCDHERVEISITDQGKGFDPSKVPDPRSDELLEIPGGRGVLLIGEIMSEVRYNAKGNQIKMVKIKGDNPLDDDSATED